MTCSPAPAPLTPEKSIAWLFNSRKKLLWYFTLKWKFLCPQILGDNRSWTDTVLDPISFRWRIWAFLQCVLLPRKSGSNICANRSWLSKMNHLLRLDSLLWQISEAKDMGHFSFTKCVYPQCVPRLPALICGCSSILMKPHQKCSRSLYFIKLISDDQNNSFWLTNLTLPCRNRLLFWSYELKLKTSIHWDSYEYRSHYQCCFALVHHHHLIYDHTGPAWKLFQPFLNV